MDVVFSAGSFVEVTQSFLSHSVLSELREDFFFKKRKESREEAHAGWPASCVPSPLNNPDNSS